MGLSSNRNLRTASPWWASLVYLVGLGLLFVGQRALYGVDGVGTFTTVAGAAAVLAIVVVRAWTTLASTGGRRRVERTLLLCHLGGLVALAAYLLTTKTGMDLVGTADLSAKGMHRYQTALLIVWGILILTSLIPLCMIELSLGVASRSGFDLARRSGDDAVEYFRVREIGISGLSIALAASFLMVTCQVATQKNVRRDVSYFKTSAPGESTIKIVNFSAEPFKVVMFFPEVNEVKEEAMAYFESLAAATSKVEIQHLDRMIDAKVAEKYGVKKDGTVVLVRGDKHESIELDTDIEKARRGKSKLRTLNREVNTKLRLLVSKKNKAYLTVGHGGINDADSVAPELRASVPPRRVAALKARLAELQYEMKELGLVDLAVEVPEDATVVLMLAPTQPLAPEELATLDRYLEKGGRLLVALDPRSEATLGPLESRLGLTFDRTPIVEDKVYLRLRNDVSDRRLAVTTQFSAHASTTALSRSVDKGLLLIDAGALKDHAFAPGGEKTKRTYVIRSMVTSWQDLDDDLTFDDGTEKRERYNIGAAIEGPELPSAAGDDAAAAKDAEKEKDAKGKDGKDAEKGKDDKSKDEATGFRAMVFSDVDLFADRPFSAAPLLVSGPLLSNAMDWLSGKSVFAGEVVSEEDVPIKHTRNQDATWFLLTIVGAPLLVLGIGLSGTMLRRRRRAPKPAAKPAEVKP